MYQTSAYNFTRAPADDCAGCGHEWGCGGPSEGQQQQQLVYIGGGRGEFTQDSVFRYTGHGGDYTSARPRSRSCGCCSFFCLIPCFILACLLLVPMLLEACLMFNDWYEGRDCNAGALDWKNAWSKNKQEYCCREYSLGCLLEEEQSKETEEETEDSASRPRPPVQPAPQGGPVDPFNCAMGDQNIKAGWSMAKKKWCCANHHKGCPNPGESWHAVPASWYDCQAGLPNFAKGWSTAKKLWCCTHESKGCLTQQSLNDQQAANLGFGAGVQQGQGALGAPLAQPQRGTR